MQAAGSSLYQLQPGIHHLQVELTSDDNQRCRPDIVYFYFDHSPVEPGTWSDIKALY